MNRIIKLLVPLIFICLSSSAQKDKWVVLFNGKDLQGWDTYMGPQLGVNNDPKQVFSVVAGGGENVIRVTGEGWGGISTINEFENYHAQLQFKWGTLTWGNKKGKKMDSGFLYHAVGKHGADANAWMRSQEFQIEQGNTGDYWGVAGGIQDIPVTKQGNNYVYDANGTLSAFSATSATGRHGTKGADAEKPTGEWNTLDLYCFGDTSIHVVNGKVVMVLFNSRQVDNGVESPLKKGKIQLQSEGAEVFYKGIKLQQISAIPANIKKQAGLK